MQRKVILEDKNALRRLDNFLYASLDKQRFLVYANVLGQTKRVIKYETDEKLCYFVETQTPRMGAKGFISRSSKEGVTFNKNTKKLSIWFGKKPVQMSETFISAMMIDLGHNWYDEMPHNLHQIATRMIWERIFKGLVNAPVSFCETYVKYHLRIKEVNYLDYYKVLLTEKVDFVGTLNYLLRTAVDPCKVLTDYSLCWSKLSNLNMQSLMETAKILGRKIDWSLSMAQLMRLKLSWEREVEALHKEYKVVEEFYEYEETPYAEGGIQNNLSIHQKDNLNE